MAYLYGRQWSRAALLARVGDLAQVAGVRVSQWDDGPERGIRVAEVRTGSGLEFTVLLDRGMDIGPAAYRGLPLAWISPAGFGHPAYYEPEGIGWLRTFGGGLMTGCGLTYLGAPDVDQGEVLGVHGRVSHLPVRQAQAGEKWEGDECRLWVAGEMRQARIFGENLRLTRQITSWLGQSRIAIHDMVENLSDATAPLMILYHINLGFPLLDHHARLVALPHTVKPRDRDAEPGLTDWMRFQPPTPGYREQVFNHDLLPDAEGWAGISLVNPTLGLSVSVRHRKDTLPNLVQWKMMGQGAYVLGLEPANCGTEGRSKERERGTLQFLEPGERREFQVEIEVQEEV
jgi:hypothetical protein